MSKQRASIFDADAEALDVSSFHPKTEREAAAPTREEAKAIAEAASFPSRQAVKPAPTPAAPQPAQARAAPLPHRPHRAVQRTHHARDSRRLLRHRRSTGLAHGRNPGTRPCGASARIERGQGT